MAGTAVKIRKQYATNTEPDRSQSNINSLVADLEQVRQDPTSCTLASAGLAIFGAGSAIVKAVNAVQYMASSAVGVTPVYGKTTASMNMAALVGSVTAAKFNVFVFSWSDDGTGTRTLKAYMGVEGATRAAVVFPTVPTNEAVAGFVEINPTGTGNFVGGTTVLDDATVVPNASYVNIIGAPVLSATRAASALTAYTVATFD